MITPSTIVEKLKRQRKRKIETRTRVVSHKRSENVEVEVSLRPEDWLKGEAQWQKLKTQTGTISYNNLFDFQQALWGMVVRNPKSVAGLPVLVVADRSGVVHTNYPYPASIIKAFEEAGQLMFTVMFHPIEEENWNDDRIEDVKLYQLMPLETPEPLTTKEKEELEMALMLTQLNLARNSTLTKLRKQEQDYLGMIANLQRDLAKYEGNLVEAQKQIKAGSKDFLTTSDLKEIINDISHNKRIDWAMLTKQGHIIAQTIPLFAFSKKLNQERKDKPIGRFVFYLNPRYSEIKAVNLDYSYSGHGHPNLNRDHICLGSNATPFTNLLQTGKFYDLLDELVTFFTLFPHDSGSPYVRHSDWLRYRGLSSQPNPWGNEEALYKVTRSEKVTNRVLRKKGQPIEAITPIATKKRGGPKKVQSVVQPVEEQTPDGDEIWLEENQPPF